MKIGLIQTFEDVIADIPQEKINLKTLLSNYFYNTGFRVLLNHRIGDFFYFSCLFVKAK